MSLYDISQATSITWLLFMYPIIIIIIINQNLTLQPTPILKFRPQLLKLLQVDRVYKYEYLIHESTTSFI